MSKVLRDLPVDLQPRARMTYAGAGALNNSELLAITIGAGRPGANALDVAQELITDAGSLLNLGHRSLEELARHPGIGPAKAAQIKAAFELGTRLASGFLNQPDPPTIRCPADAANLVMLEMMQLEQEEFRVAVLNTQNTLIRIITLYKGNLNTAVVRIGEVFRDAIRLNAAGIIVLHNHPSGDPTPSPEDVRITEQIVEAGRLLDIEVFDHVIIGRNRYVSLKERGLGFRR